MGQPVDVNQLSDSEMAAEFLERGLLSKAQIKAALDYQLSVGGRLSEVVLKLGLVRDDVLHSFLERLSAGEDFVLERDAETVEASPSERVPQIDFQKLRVHRKLLEKVPKEIVDKYGILFFFPPSKTRAILMSTDREVGVAGVAKLADLLGVEIRVIHLDPDVHARLREQLGPRENRRHREPEEAQSSSAHGASPQLEALNESSLGSLVAQVQEARGKEANNGPGRDLSLRGLERSHAGGNGDPHAVDVLGEVVAGADERDLVRAVLSLLVKKQVVALDEVEVEIEIARVKSRRHSGLLA